MYGVRNAVLCIISFMSSQAVQTSHLQYIKESVGLSPVMKDFDEMKNGKTLHWLCGYVPWVPSLFKK